MAKKSKGATFAELLKQPTWSEGDGLRSRKPAVRPAGHNAAGEFFDPSGRALLLLHENVTPDLAHARVRSGALLAYEGCGCGGWTRCQPDWLSSDALSRLHSASAPEFVKGHRAPTWIDVWSSDLSQVVVYLHGDVRWGDVIP